MKGKTTIPLKMETRDRLKEERNYYRETYDDLINRLLDEIEQNRESNID